MRWGRGMGVGVRKCAGAGTKVRCGGGVRMGAGVRKCAGAGAGVRRCVEEGVLLWVRAYGCGRAQVRRRGEEGVLRWGRAYGCGRAKVRRRGGAFTHIRGRRCAAVGARDGRGRAVSLQGFIRIYRNQSELIGGNRICSDKF